MVVGREGGIRVQYRFGDVFLQRIDFERRSYFYQEAPFKVHSRSGHTATVLSQPVVTASEVLLIFSGRQREHWRAMN